MHRTLELRCLAGLVEVGTQRPTLAASAAAGVLVLVAPPLAAVVAAVPFLRLAAFD